MPEQPFDTPLQISGPFATPKQMLAEQEYFGSTSIHDDETAEKLGFAAGGPIEGPTHFSQFVPLAAHLWGKAWFETGTLSAHFQNMVVEGEEVRANITLPQNNETTVPISAEKKDGTPVLAGTASIGTDHPPSALHERLERFQPAEKLIILRDMKVGDQSPPERIKMDFDQHLGGLYPFTLRQKLDAITANSSWHTDDGKENPWGRPIIPLEMVCVLTQYTIGTAGWKIRQPHIGLFADLETGMLKGPLFVGQEYILERKIVALGETRRTEGFWEKSLIRDVETNEVLAYNLLHHAAMKNSFPDYEKELAAS